MPASLLPRSSTMNHFRTSLCAALVSAWLAGCGSSVKLDDAAPVVDAKPNPAGSNAANANAGRGVNSGQSSVTTVDASKNDALAGVGRVVYFDYDSYALKDE